MASARILCAWVAAAAVLAGCGGDEEGAVPAGESPEQERVVASVEGVDGGEVTQGDLLEAMAEGGREPPAADSPEFDLAAGAALDRLVLARWIRGEAAEQGGEVPEEDAAVFAEQMDAASAEELAATWGPRTECDPGPVSRLCDGGEEDGPEPPPDIPPASGLEEPPG